MSATDPRSFPVSVQRACDPDSAARAASREMRFRKMARVSDAVLAKVHEGDPVAPSDYRDTFPRQFMRALRAVFRNCDQVAQFFDVTERQARNMWAGRNTPTGDKVAMFALTYPQAFAHHCGGVAV